LRHVAVILRHFPWIAGLAKSCADLLFAAVVTGLSRPVALRYKHTAQDPIAANLTGARMAFLTLSFLMSMVVAAFVLVPLFRRRENGGAAVNPDLLIYRDQLHEVERDLDRNLLSNDEADRTRTEISRRILAADAGFRANGGNGPRWLRNSGAVLIAVVLMGGSAALYTFLGANGAPDQPLAARLADIAARQDRRPDQHEAEARVGDLRELAVDRSAEYLALVAQLRETARARPDDLTGQRLLAQHEAQIGEFRAAYQAQAKVINLLGVAVGAQDYTDLAELMIIAADGYVSPEAEKVLAGALELDPREPRARYYSGLDLAQNGRPDLAYRLWLELLVEGPPDAPWIAPIRAQIDTVAQRAGIGSNLTRSAGASAPTEDPAQLEMIENMVAGLAERLTDEGGTPNEWARLIRSYAVLGEIDKARSTLANALAQFAGNDDATAILQATAQDSGLTE